jgi:hypothetical protein
MIWEKADEDPIAFPFNQISQIIGAIPAPILFA